MGELIAIFCTLTWSSYKSSRCHVVGCSLKHVLCLQEIDTVNKELFVKLYVNTVAMKSYLP